MNLFSYEFTREKLSNLVRKFKYAKLDIILKIKPVSDSICKYEKLKLWHSGEIYLMVHDGNHELAFCNRIPNEKHEDKI